MTSTRILIEIDFQGWILAASASDGVAERARAVRDRWRAQGGRVFCTRYLSHDPDDPLRSDPEGPGAAFHPLLRPDGDDLVLTKDGQDITANPDLQANLQLAGANGVVLTGVATEHGVSLAAGSLRELGYDVCVVADACAGETVAAHEAALARLVASGISVRASEHTPAPRVGS